jgi:hypothetical protein
MFHKTALILATLVEINSGRKGMSVFGIGIWNGVPLFL